MYRLKIPQQEKFKIISLNKETHKVELDEVSGERISIEGLACFIFIDEEIQEGIYEGEVIEWYNISHLNTGMRVAYGLSKNEAISTAKLKCAKFPECIEKGIETIKGLNIGYPINI